MFFGFSIHHLLDRMEIRKSVLGTSCATLKGNIGFRISVTRNKILNVQIILFFFHVFALILFWRSLYYKFKLSYSFVSF